LLAFLLEDMITSFGSMRLHCLALSPARGQRLFLNF
jgi:hypothetical protein